MCELQEMADNDNFGVPLIFGLLVGLFMCGMLSHAAIGRPDLASRRHYTFTSTSDTEMELPTRNSNTTTSPLAPTTNDDPTDGSNIYEEAIRPID
jgi:hypothetical protein